MPLETAPTIAFTEEDWQRIGRDWTAWWNHELDRPLVMVETIAPSTPPLEGYQRYISNFPDDWSAQQIIDLNAARLARHRYHGDAFPKFWLDYGPGILAGFLGCIVEVRPDTVWYETAGQPTLNDLAEVSLTPANAWLHRAEDFARRAVDRLGKYACIGFTDLGGNLDVLSSLRGAENLLMDVLDDPDAVERVSRRITTQWLDAYERSYDILRPSGRGTAPWAAIWSPKRCYMLQCDFSYMISPEHFERFVVPDLTACCDHLDHGFYHLDGPGQLPHVDLLLGIERLRGIQWIPGAGNPTPENWLDLLRRIREVGKLCQLYVTPDGALKIKEELGGKGFMFCIIDHGLNAEDAEALVQQLHGC